MPSQCSQQGHRQQRWTLAVGAMLIAAAWRAAPSPRRSKRPAQARSPRSAWLPCSSQLRLLDAVPAGAHPVPLMTAEVRPQVSGIIQQRLFTEGALVKQGQQLYQIDADVERPPRPALRLPWPRPKPASVRWLQRHGAMPSWSRSTRSANRRLTSCAAAAQSASDVAVAKAKSLETARINLKYSRIEAPIGGRIALVCRHSRCVEYGQSGHGAHHHRAAGPHVCGLHPVQHRSGCSSSAIWIPLPEGGRQQDSRAHPARRRQRLPASGQAGLAGVIVNDTTGTLTFKRRCPIPTACSCPACM